MSPEQEAKLSEAASEASLWASLMEHPGWKRLVELKEAQVAGRMKTLIHQPLKSADDVYGQEFMKGEVSGIELFCSLPEIQRSVAQEVITDLQKENDDAQMADDDATDGGSDGNGGGRKRDVLDGNADTFVD